MLQLKLILWKNLVIRKRHWLLTLAEILIPIVLFTLVAYGRSKVTGMNKVYIDSPTYNKVHTIDDIYSHLDVGELNLWYSPYTEFTENIVRKVQETFQIPGDAVNGFDSEERLLNHFNTRKNCSSLVAVINFHGSDSRHLDYDLSLYDKYVTWDTDKLFVPIISEEDKGSSKYIYKGFAALQVAIDLAFIEMSGPSNQNIEFSIQEFPDPPHAEDAGLNQLFMYFLPLITIFSFIFLCPAVLQRVGEEKYSGTKEYMKMVGMSSSLIWLGWLIHGLITNLFSIIAVVVLMKVPFWGVPYPPIEYSDGVVLFMFLFLYCMAAITFCFLIATIISRPSIATVVGLLIWIFSYFLPRGLVATYENLEWKWKIPFALFPNMALHYGYTSISFYEMREVGIQWYNMFQSGSGGENDVTMGNVFVMLILDMFLFMSLTIYIENVKPGEYGIPKPYSFPLISLKNWTRRSFQNSHHTDDIEIGSLRHFDEHKTPCIEIINLQKRFNKTVAVENLSMDIYKDNITVLLGHNGAGKTTTMSILTGMINATSGCIRINGKDITTHTNDVRKMLGLCPQHNLLFPDLTVFEHLKFFAMIKGSTSVNKDAQKMMENLGLVDKKNNMPSTLSGGMKRKLCLGMALIGNSEVLILDEPTTGMDPESRRKVWDMLLEYRKSKTILITTHFMEEADVLGDYIAIMANGCLLCYDTPIHLKQRYNTGYHVSLNLKTKIFVENITKEIKKQIPDAELLREIGDTVVYLLPMDKKEKYKDVLFALEEQKEQWGIVYISISLTTLSDVFFKAKDENIKFVSPIKHDDDVNSECENLLVMNENSKFSCGWWTNTLALTKKRWYFLKRKFHWYLPALIISAIIFLLGIWLGISNTDYSSRGEPKLNLSLKVYDKSYAYYGGDSVELTKIKINYSKTVEKQEGHSIFYQDVFAGIILEGIRNIAFYKRHMAVAAVFNETSPNEIVVNAMFNRLAIHGAPVSINLAMNAAIKSLLNENFSISTTNKPLSSLNSQFSPAELSPVSVLSVWIILLPLSMLFFISNYLIFPNSEISTNFLQVQTLVGVRTHVYWLTNAVVDILLSLLQLLALFSWLIVLNWLVYNGVIFQKREFGALFAIISMYVLVSLPHIYLLSYRKTVTGGFSLLLILGILTGLTPTIAVVALEFSKDEYHVKIAEIIKHIFMILSPHFSLNYLCVKFTKKFVNNFNWEYMNPSKRDHICKQEPNPCCYGASDECSIYQNYFLNQELGIFNDLLEMLSSFVLYFFLLMILDAQWFQKVSHFVKYLSLYLRTQSRSNPAKENDGKNSPDEDPILIADNLTKTFGLKKVVRDLSLLVKRNKCFGLLGVNGAGKSTTFSMLTKSLFFDKGTIEIQKKKGEKEEKISVKSDNYTRNIGFCAQDDRLNFFLTGKELIYTMALLRGYPQDKATQVTESLLECFGLHDYKDIVCIEYSGGNKRKLCACMAFLGSPEVILLDEPTSGVDPSSRRDFWKILNAFKEKQKTSFLLCSHSMEECENLCDDIAIMKAGKIEDEGSLLDLKKRYHKGFKVTIKLNNAGDTKLIEKEIENQKNFTLKNKYAEYLEYQVKDEKRLSNLFVLLESLKTKYEGIDDFIVDEISLEDVFLKIAEK